MQSSLAGILEWPLAAVLQPVPAEVLAVAVVVVAAAVVEVAVALWLEQVLQLAE